ncbi:MAG: ATP-grasp domain-containing protein [Cyclobacteriaceae bacterium]|nr:ATP-grasp domain-containing protein [Cyclobacteriaceae bacterium]
MNPAIWINHPLAPCEEIDAAASVARRFFYRFRSQIPAQSVVFSRYGSVPNPHELELELKWRGSRCVNPASVTKAIENFEWYEILVRDGIRTPRTWFEGFDSLPEGRYVAKGRTNSRKWNWCTHMYAEDLGSLLQVRQNLYDDPFIAEQGIVVREFIEFDSYDKDVNGMPVTNEYRVFVLDGKVIASGFYWANWIYELEQRSPERDWNETPEPAIGLARDAARSLGYPFVAVDVASVGDEWVVVEVNDGNMSGLCCIDPETFYRNLLHSTGVPVKES